jgi:hypothetical protein
MDFYEKSHETDIKKLNQLIKQAGNEARNIKKNVLSAHYKKIQAAVKEGVVRRQPRD